MGPRAIDEGGEGEGRGGEGTYPSDQQGRRLLGDRRHFLRLLQRRGRRRGSLGRLVRARLRR
jgi:hypothetical protein